ncbi:fam-d protein [Plasmodium vinckei brucechwatti]|uniref:Fam-d protein n=1 Tax=Plasmodium vinckei brucechwatti TaxID=119398 RepID=A0A6V7S4B9_PLAVN|nr:fam-d protein [Plasmodium vinckei brucechwatti]
MQNIILSFFILVIFSNVKAATLQDENSNSPKTIRYVSVDKPFVSLHEYNKNYYNYLDIIDHILNYESENTKYACQGNNYHWVITGFHIYINNTNIYFDKIQPKVIISSTMHFISYIKENIKCLATQHICKYDFEKNHDNNLNKLANDLKGLIYDKFDKDSEDKIYDKFVNDLKGFTYDKYGKDLKDLISSKFDIDLKPSTFDKFSIDLKRALISFKGKNTDEKPPNKAKDIFKTLVHNSEINIRGYFIKIRKDGNYKDLCQNKSLYFNISISRNDANANYDLKHSQPEIAKLVSIL